MYLEKIQSPAQLKQMSFEQTDILCKEIRDKIIDVVSKNGGHLSSNLGIVELTVALHRVLNCPEDKIIFDVGHQCYAHKLLTNRYEKFDTLRKTGGICGFPRVEESEYDCFNSGHASNGISAALGMARARDLLGEKKKIAVIIRDGALTGGMAYEALNDIGSNGSQLMIILNDNGMSISKNVGALNDYLTHLRTSKGWKNLKKRTSSFMLKIPFCGKALHDFFQKIKNMVRGLFIRDRFFSSMGLHYFGPVDGNNVKALTKSIERIKDYDQPCILHVCTEKGSGYHPAEDRPDLYHGTPPFCVETGSIDADDNYDFGKSACDILMEYASEDNRICVVTAAMTGGTGMKDFAEKYPGRLFDVGIAEEHAVTLSAGLALGGMRPFTAIYDSFLQRGFDQIIEDISMQKAPVCLLCDRAGIGSHDGSSHHGLFGTGFLSCVPGLTVLAPVNLKELKQQIKWVLSQNMPVAIRYPKAEKKRLSDVDVCFVPGKWSIIREGNDAAVISYSSTLSQVLAAADICAGKGISVKVINASTICMVDEKCLSEVNIPFIIAEESVYSGSLGEKIAAYFAGKHITPRLSLLNAGEEFLPHGSHKDLLRMVHLDAESIADRIIKEITTL
ncbi:MAG: 1-deoxy-D-xylulose-5-phosphate synthase [Clostridiales bacterium]|nr:1-deoxy-D-xylulose-5-phosphate synthase [Clostridiales bacterium]